MPLSAYWGIGVGLVIAAIDAASLVLKGSPGTSQWPIDDVNLLANVALYSLIGFRVGRATGVVRDAAEAGVLGGIVVAAIGIAIALIVRPQVGGLDSTSDLVGVVAVNVAMGGVLSIMTGWLGTRARADGPSRG